MASTCIVPGLVVNEVGLISTTKTSYLDPAIDLATNTSFTFPSVVGGTGFLYMNAGGGYGTWGTATNVLYPIANDDFYRIRTNELLNGNVVTGFGGNSGGVDTLGSGSSPIQSITIVTQPKQGLLTITGATGAFTYRSNPRYTGLDFFCYYITDTSGKSSFNRGTCTISVESNPPLGNFTGPYFIYSTTGSTNIIQYNDGTQTTLFAATYPSGPTGSGVGTLATNRDDNLVYYCSSNATGASLGLIYAYDYVNDYQFLLGNAGTDSRFFNNTNVNFNETGACYRNSMLYIAQNASGGTGIYKISLSPYSYTAGVGGSQQIRGVMYTTLTQTLSSTSFAWDPLSMKLVVCGTTGGSARIVLFNSSAADEIYGSTGGILAVNRNITTGPDNMFYTTNPTSLVVRNLALAPLVLGTSYANLSFTGAADMGEYISQPV